MKTSSLNQINSRLKVIPDNFAGEIIAYLDFLSFKANTDDWATTLTAKDFELIQRGTADLKNGKVYSHTAAMKKINAHVKAKAK
jgi:hypothetical protein